MQDGQDHRLNGADPEQNEKMELIERIGELARQAKPPAVIEHVKDELEAFEQDSHTLMIKSLDLVAQQWVEQLQHIRDNTKQLEQMVLSTLGRAKHDVTELHLLGAQVLKEVERGDEICTQLADKIDRLMGERRS